MSTSHIEAANRPYNIANIPHRECQRPTHPKIDTIIMWLHLYIQTDVYIVSCVVYMYYSILYYRLYYSIMDLQYMYSICTVYVYSIQYMYYIRNKEN